MLLSDPSRLTWPDTAFEPDPFINATFSITIPTGVTVLPSSWRSSPKLATTPTVDMAAEKLTWQLGSVRTGAKVKISMKLVADACTTPAILPLAGRFAYTDAEGAKAVDACLKKPVRAVWCGVDRLLRCGMHASARASAPTDP